MTRPTITIHNVATNEIVEREMNDLEFNEYEALIVSQELAKAEAEAKATQKAALLDRLGITENEAKLLLA
jgi:hypothetical protein